MTEQLLRENEQICSVSLYVANSTVQNLLREANSSSARRKIRILCNTEVHYPI